MTYRIRRLFIEWFSIMILIAGWAVFWGVLFGVVIHRFVTRGG